MLTVEEMMEYWRFMKLSMMAYTVLAHTHTHNEELMEMTASQ